MIQTKHIDIGKRMTDIYYSIHYRDYDNFPYCVGLGTTQEIADQRAAYRIMGHLGINRQLYRRRYRARIGLKRLKKRYLTFLQMEESGGFIDRGRVE